MHNSLTLPLSEDAKKVILSSEQIAKNYAQTSYSPAHLLRAILQNKTIRKQLEDSGFDVLYLEDWADTRIETTPKAFDNKAEIYPDDKFLDVLDEADNIRAEIDSNDINCWALLAALAVPDVGFTTDQLKTIQLSKQQVLGVVYLNNKNIRKTMNPKPIKQGGDSENFATSQTEESDIYENKTTKVLKKNQQIVCREKAIQTTIEILSRHTKPNILLIGESGVGKTAVIDGVSQALMKDSTIEELRNTPIFEINLLNLLSSNGYRGEAVDKLKKGLIDLAHLPRIILSIEDIHQLLVKNSPIEAVGNWIKAKLNDFEFSIIATTTPDDFTKSIEKDASFLKYFEVIHLEEPPTQDAIKMIESLQDSFQEHHQLSISKATILEAIRLASRFLKSRALPDSAIDLIDRTMASVKMTKQQSLLISELIKQAIFYQEKEETEKLENILAEMKRLLSPILASKLEIDKEDIHIDSLIQLSEKLNRLIEQPILSIENVDLATIVGDKTGIPVGKLQSHEQERLLQMEDHLKQRVVGQDHAIKSVSDAIIEARSGLNEERKPIGSFFLLGPTGTGKTELARTLADFLFQDENFMIRFNMSEFKEEHSAALLYGAPPGYVGYEEGGLLVNKIRQQPYSVVLFDEIEKAHSSVFDVFLQILDEGKLEDKLGREGDFSNAVVLFTSNIAQQYIVECFKKGKIPSQADLMEQMSRHFRPEFLARLTEIVPFSYISQDMVLGIFKIQLRSLIKTLEKKEIVLEISEDAQIALANSGYSPDYGARPLKGVIRDKIRRPLSRMMVAGQVNAGDTVLLTLTTEGDLHWGLK